MPKEQPADHNVFWFVEYRLTVDSKDWIIALGVRFFRNKEDAKSHANDVFLKGRWRVRQYALFEVAK